MNLCYNQRSRELRGRELRCHHDQFWERSVAGGHSGRSGGLPSGGERRQLWAWAHSWLLSGSVLHFTLSPLTLMFSYAIFLHVTHMHKWTVLWEMGGHSWVLLIYFCFFEFKYIFILCIFRERGRERERERNINVWLPLTHPLPGTCPIAQTCALTGN